MNSTSLLVGRVLAVLVTLGMASSGTTTKYPMYQSCSFTEQCSSPNRDGSRSRRLLRRGEPGSSPKRHRVLTRPLGSTWRKIRVAERRVSFLKRLEELSSESSSMMNFPPTIKPNSLLPSGISNTQAAHFGEQRQRCPILHSATSLTVGFDVGRTTSTPEVILGNTRKMRRGRQDNLAISKPLTSPQTIPLSPTVGCIGEDTEFRSSNICCPTKSALEPTPDLSTSKSACDSVYRCTPSEGKSEIPLISNWVVCVDPLYSSVHPYLEILDLSDGSRFSIATSGTR